MGTDTAAALPGKPHQEEASALQGESGCCAHSAGRSNCSLNVTLGSNHRLMHETDPILSVTYGAVHVGAREGAVDG